MNKRHTVKAVRTKSVVLGGRTLYGWYVLNPSGHRCGAYVGRVAR